MYIKILHEYYRGQSDKKRQPFRESYDRIGGLRSVLPKAVMVAMTATASSDIVSSIKTSLSMSSDSAIIRVSPDKPNIRYVFNYNKLCKVLGKLCVL